MPLQTETLAILNELDRPLSGNRRQDQLYQYVRDVAAAHRNVYPADDATVVTLAWIVSIGGTDADPSVFDIPSETDATIGFTVADGTATPTITAPVSETVELPGITTRGGVRRLLTALGVVYTGHQAP